MSKLLTISAFVLAVSSAGAAAQDAPAPEAQPAMPAPAACTLDKAFSCRADGGCSSSDSFGELKLPAKVLVQYEKQIVATADAEGLPRVSSIHAISTVADTITVQGAERGTGWALLASRSKPGMTFTVSSETAVITAFGTCKTLK
jgi:hypothetical protein